MFLELYLIGCMISFGAALAAREEHELNAGDIFSITVLSWVTVGAILADMSEMMEQVSDNSKLSKGEIEECQKNIQKLSKKR